MRFTFADTIRTEPLAARVHVEYDGCADGWHLSLHRHYLTGLIPALARQSADLPYLPDDVRAALLSCYDILAVGAAAAALAALPERDTGHLQDCRPNDVAGALQSASEHYFAGSALSHAPAEARSHFLLAFTALAQVVADGAEYVAHHAYLDCQSERLPHAYADAHDAYVVRAAIAYLEALRRPLDSTRVHSSETAQ